MPLPAMNVEIDGKIVSRLRVVRILSSDEKGTVTCTQPQLWPGEVLVMRPGAIPTIVKESDMPDASEVYRHQIVRSVLGTHPAMLAKEADPTALNGLCRQLVDAQDAKALLRANGCGRHTDSLASMVRMLLEDRGRKA
jgi:hypothetical protein